MGKDGFSNFIFVVGFIIGVRCDSLCDPGRYGSDCSEKCVCENKGSCNQQTGECYCARGWEGEHCENSCSPGFYGQDCKEKCPSRGYGNIK